MKKTLSLVLALVLTVSLALPAAAADAADQRLTAVVTQIKKTLGLDTDRYTSFYGDLDDNPLAPTWYLDWSDDEGNSLSIQATEAGKVTSYSLYERSTASTSAGIFAPKFPEGDREKAQAAALDFLQKVLAKEESVRLEEDTSPLRLDAETFRFRGEILVNGLSAGLTFSVTVRCADNRITRFYRDDYAGTVMGGVPSPKASVSAGTAASALRGTLSLRLEYVLPEDGGQQAVLRWLPDGGDEYYVDAAAGTLVDLTELYRKAAEGGLGDAGGAASNDSVESAAPDLADGGLSSAEQAGVAKLEGVLDREALDKKVRDVSALGLTEYTLAAASYSVARETEEGEQPLVTAVLRYGRQADGVSRRRTVTVDARTGELLSVYSSGRLPDGAAVSVGLEQARTKAEAFLSQLGGAQFAKTDLYASSEAAGQWSWSHSFTYAQKENGYFYPGNGFRVGIDAGDGSVSEYEKYFDDSVTFDSAEGVCTRDQALDAWLGTYETVLRYVLAPAAIDFSKPEYAPLEDMGLSYLYRMVLGYQLERETTPLGIDAKTVQPVYRPQRVQDSMAYSDVAGHWAQKQIETLARYGVGFTGGTFRPEAALRQIDLVALLVSTAGYTYYPEEEGAADRLYDRAYGMGILSAADRDDDAALTRAEAVRLILDAAGYAEVAALKGIFRTSFADDGQIPAADYGYAALAQGLGVVHGEPGGRFQAGAKATRAEAAVMLYNLMSR